jgi:hypothetical protein
MTARPDSAQQWRDATAVFGTADWDTGALHGAAVVDADKAGPHADDAAAALAGDAAAAARLGVAGVVALTTPGAVFEVEETVDGWTLTPSAGTPDVADLAMAAAIRATQFGAQRRGEEWR